METNRNISNLTLREFEVMEKVSIGKPNKIIADELDCKIDTIKTHLKNTFPKLHVQNRTEAALKFNELMKK